MYMREYPCRKNSPLFLDTRIFIAISYIKLYKIPFSHLHYRLNILYPFRLNECDEHRYDTGNQTLLSQFKTEYHQNGWSQYL